MSAYIVSVPYFSLSILFVIFLGKDVDPNNFHYDVVGKALCFHGTIAVKLTVGFRDCSSVRGKPVIF